ncbi:MAG TPA: amidohydrolase [Candidatus Limnocylindrales bacterium]|nr:amidohydrolase [Candidatus Limnocylindrales bacterium]
MSLTPRATLVVRGRIATLAGDDGPAWVDAIGVADGRVVAAGSLDEVAAAAGPAARVLQLRPDEAAVPGLTDSHLHLVEAALARSRVQLEDADSIAVLVGRVRDHAERAPADAWVLGAGWDPDRLGRWPTADDLEDAAPGRRVALWAHDHHALLASRAALGDGGVGESTADPAGGVIRRDEHGRPTGVLHEVAARLVARRIPPPTVEDLRGAMRPLIAELVALGVTAVHDPGGLSEQRDLTGPIDAYRALAAAGELSIRAHPCIRPEQLDAAEREGIRSGQPLGPDPLDRLRLGWLKTFADGSLGSRTAALLEPLERSAGEAEPPNGGYGVWLTPPRELQAQAARAASLGIATQIHGIGDAAVRAALDALAPTVGATSLVPRIEHTQLVHPDDVPRFAALGVAASFQPVHVRSDAQKARRLWGERADASSYALGAIARTGALIPTGTDAPVEPIDPWPGVACAVTRAAPTWPSGTPPLGLPNAVSLWRSVRAACVDPPLTAGEHDRGRLVPGHRADLVVLPAGALAEPVEVGGALWHARPRLVMLDGEVVAEA